MQSDPYHFSKDGFLEQQPVCRRLRSNIRPQMPVTSGHRTDECKPCVEDDLLGEDGLGLSTEEFSNLQESERKQLLEAVLQSKEDFQLKERNTKMENPISSLESSKHQAGTSSLRCSIPVGCLKLTDGPLGRITMRPSLERVRLKSASAVATEVIKDDSVVDPAPAWTVSKNTAGAANSDLGNWSKTMTDESKSEQNIPAAASRKELIWDQSYLSPAKQLIRKYRVQVVDKRPSFCRQKGLSMVDRVQMILSYLTEMEELLYRQSSSTRNLLVPWGKPIPIEVAKNRRLTRMKSHVNAVKNDVGDLEAEFDEGLAVLDINGTEQGQNANEGHLNTNEGLLNTDEGCSDQASMVEARGSLVKTVDVTLDSRWRQEDIESRLQNSRQMKIGGGVAEEGPPKVLRRKSVKQRTAKESEENSDNVLSSKAKSGKRKKPGDYLKKVPRVSIKKNKNNAEEVKDNNSAATAEESSSTATREISRLSGDAKPANQFLNSFEGKLEGVSKDQTSGGLMKGKSYRKIIVECDSDEEFVVPPNPISDADHRSQTEVLQSTVLGRPSIRSYTTRKRKNSPSSSGRNSLFQDSRPHYDFFSDEEPFEDDGKKTGRRKESDPDFVSGKASSKKQIKPGNEQLTMKSFSAYNSSLPKVQKLNITCPMCQIVVSESDYKDHVQECVDRNDVCNKSRTRGTSRT